MKNKIVEIQPFKRRDVVLCPVSESEMYALETQCVSSQTEYGPIKLCIGVNASDRQLRSASDRYNVAIRELEQFRALLNVRLSLEMTKQ